MRSRADDVRKRIAKRKREKDRLTNNQEKQLHWLENEEKNGLERMPFYEGGPGDTEHPLFKKEIFLFKVLVSACLVLVIAIIFRNENSSLQPVKNFVTNAMEQDFQFVAVSNWYEEQFGKPLAILPFEKEQADPSTLVENQEYALPATARILEDFEENGQRITIETPLGAAVTAMTEGRVRFAGIDEEFGKTVIIQHADKSETWYGNLDSINVTLYEFVKKGAELGTASNNEVGTMGTFYFALKQGDDFKDPVQVIQFD